MASSETVVAIIGAGTIGLSFAALHLSQPSVRVIIYDPRPDLTTYIQNKLPSYLSSTWRQPSPPPTLAEQLSRLSLSPTLAGAVEAADIVQEQGPETIPFKQSTWQTIESLAPSHALFWSSTSGIPSSVQAKHMARPTRLLVVHPYNPPHVMPLLEIVPPLLAEESHVQRTMAYWKALGREPVVLREEITGFVANRLAFALLREAADLAHRGVASAEEIDKVVEQSLGPRWAVRGPFWSYHAGGGEGGIRAFFDKIGGTVQACWDDGARINLRRGEEWEDGVCAQVEQAYGSLGEEQLRQRDEGLKRVLDGARP